MNFGKGGEIKRKLAIKIQIGENDKDEQISTNERMQNADEIRKKKIINMGLN